jgi:class 3 adenylate cyclase
MTPSPADLASLTGMPAESSTLADLCAAMDARTGLAPEITQSPQPPQVPQILESPLSAQIARGVEAGVRAALAGGPAPLDAVPDPVRRPSTPALLADGQMCGVLGVDIAGFAGPKRDDVIRRHLHEQLYQMVPAALDASGVPWASCRHEDRGDAVFVVIPPEISTKGLIDPFPERLRSLIRRHNHVSCPAACLQLRAALHVGPVDYDGHGFVGADVNFMFRMLDARPLKQTLKTSGAELALAVSDYVYRSVVCRYASLGYPEDFRAFRFQTKETRGQAWAYLPGSAHVTLSRSSQRTCVR